MKLVALRTPPEALRLEPAHRAPVLERAGADTEKGGELRGLKPGFGPLRGAVDQRPDNAGELLDLAKKPHHKQVSGIHVQTNKSDQAPAGLIAWMGFASVPGDSSARSGRRRVSRRYRANAIEIPVVPLSGVVTSTSQDASGACTDTSTKAASGSYPQQPEASILGKELAKDFRLMAKNYWYSRAKARS